VIRGCSLVTASGHYLASVAGLRMLAEGGNAFDAGMALVFAQSVLEFQRLRLRRRGADLDLRRAGTACRGDSRQRAAPAAATID